MREKFEKIARVKEILGSYDWFFEQTSNQYVLNSHAGDTACLASANYLDGLWYMYQEQQKKIYEVLNKMYETRGEVHYLVDDFIDELEEILK